MFRNRRRIKTFLLGLSLLPICLILFETSAEAGKCRKLSKSCLRQHAGDIISIAVPSTIVVDVVTGEKPGSTGDRVGKQVVRTVDNASDEVRRAGRNTEDAALAIGYYLDRQARGQRDAVEEAARKAREGKIVDAFWTATTDPIKGQEEAAARAVQDSSLLNTAAATAASVYGGPGGSAAYAAWYAYRASGGDKDVALKAGILAGATSVGMGGVQKMPASGVSEVARKAAVAGALGGLAVAAAGGDEDALREAFLRGGGMILLQEGYKATVGANMDGRAARGEPYCMATVGAECSPPEVSYVRDSNGNILDQKGNVYDPKGDVLPAVDVRKTDLTRPHVGTWAKAGERGWQTEAGPAMVTISKIPGMNAMSVFHDHWSYASDMGALTNVASIYPAIVVTYYGFDSSINKQITDTVVEKATHAVKAPATTAGFCEIKAQTLGFGRFVMRIPAVKFATDDKSQCPPANWKPMPSEQ
jgi:hypothetical protein